MKGQTYAPAYHRQAWLADVATSLYSTRPVQPAGHVPFLAVIALAGCAGSARVDGSSRPSGAERGSSSPDSGSPQGAQTVNPNLTSLSVDSFRCGLQGRRVEQVDLNHDGRSDLVSVYERESTTLSCRQADFNFDSRIDAYFFYGEQGELVREQFDLDYDGRIDAGRLYEEGVLTVDEQDVDRDGYVDAWRRYEKGRLLRIETDRDGDGKADMFAHYVGGQVDRVGYDTNGDGRVDQWDHDTARRARLATRARDTHAATTEDAAEEKASETKAAEAKPSEGNKETPPPKGKGKTTGPGEQAQRPARPSASKAPASRPVPRSGAAATKAGSPQSPFPATEKEPPQPASPKPQAPTTAKEQPKPESPKPQAPS